MNDNNYKKKLFNIIYKHGIILTILITFLYFFLVTNGRFLRIDNIINILRAMSIVTVIAIGVTISLVVGGFDLSVGSIASLSMAVSIAMFVWYNQSFLVTILVAVLVSTGVGLINSFMIQKLNIPDMLATLSSMFIFAGISMTFSKGKIISENMIMDDGSVSTGLIPKAFTKIGEVPTIILIMMVIVLVIHIFLTYTKHGRYMYIVGGNVEAARLSGVNVNKYKILAYALSGLMAGIGGILMASRMGQANPAAGAGYLMEAVAAAYIGFSFLGLGKANAIGTFFGSLLMVGLSNGLVMVSMPYYSMDIIKGAVLVLALALTYHKQE